MRVAVLAASEARDSDALGFPSDGVDSLEVPGRGRREAGLDDVHVQLGQLTRDLDLLRHGEAGAGRLLAITERGVEDPYWYVGGHQSSPLA